MRSCEYDKPLDFKSKQVPLFVIKGARSKNLEDAIFQIETRITTLLGQDKVSECRAMCDWVLKDVAQAEQILKKGRSRHHQTQRELVAKIKRIATNVKARLE